MTDQILHPHNFTRRELEILNKHLERYPFTVENEQIRENGKWEDTGNLALDDYAQICTPKEFETLFRKPHAGEIHVDYIHINPRQPQIQYVPIRDQRRCPRCGY